MENFKSPHTHVAEIPEMERGRGTKMFEEIMAESFPN